MGTVGSKVLWRAADITVEDTSLPNGEQRVTENPGGDRDSSGSRTPSSAAGLTPRGSPSAFRTSNLAINSGRSSHSPSPSRTLFSEQKPRKLSAAEAMKAKILVKTGDQEKSGTNANVYLQLEDLRGTKTGVLLLDQIFRDDLERGKLDSFSLMFPEGEIWVTYSKILNYVEKL